MPRAQRALGQDEITFDKPTRLRVDHARHLHPVDERDDEGNDPKTGVQQGGQHDGQEQRGEGHHEISKAHQSIADAAARIARHDAHDHADGDSHAIGDEPDHQ